MNWSQSEADFIDALSIQSFLFTEDEKLMPMTKVQGSLHSRIDNVQSKT